MRIAGIDFPEALLGALRDGELVIFAGAGVSIDPPAGLPTFTQLARQIAGGTGAVQREDDPEDRFLGRLRQDGVQVHARASQILSQPGSLPTDLHRDLLRVCSGAGLVRVVTTNFDLLFEKAAVEVFGSSPAEFVAPALPLGHQFSGIVHVHGAISLPEGMVLTDADFGRAYLTEGWARRFLVNLFRRFTALFVGYSHTDAIVSYLARALPPERQGKRFVLIGEGDNRQEWRLLGVEPITYPKPEGHDHSALYRGIRGLAEVVNRSILDWQRELTELAAKRPPVGQEQADIIKQALTDEARTRFFVSAARLPEWIAWLDERRYFDALFGQREVSGRDFLLAGWLAEHYALKQAEEMFLLVAKHRMHLHPDFWRLLGLTIFSPTGPPLDQSLMTRWVSLLTATAPPDPDEHVLKWMGDCCAKQAALPILLQVFDLMIQSRLELSGGVPKLGGDGSSKNLAGVELPLVGGDYVVGELWRTGLKPNLDRIAVPLLDSVVRRLEDRHSVWLAWQRGNRDYDIDSALRSAIEPHEQDKLPRDYGVLIDAARDCLECLASNRKTLAEAIRWCERLAVSDVPLLRRLTVHLLAFRHDLGADEKLLWLVRFGLSDVAARHEMFGAAKIAYPEAGQDARARVIEAVHAYRWPQDDDPEKDRRTARYHFEWLQWLHMAAPKCVATKRALDDVLAEYPEFKPSEHPDMTHWTTEWVGPKSPWTVEELLAKPAAEWRDELLSFQPDDILGPDRDGLVFAVAEAAKREIGWGFDLSDSLAAIKKWDIDLWEGLLRAWAAAEVNKGHAEQLLSVLRNRELQSNHSHDVADVLLALIKRDGQGVSLQQLSEANAVARALWGQTQDVYVLGRNSGDWFMLAITSAPGVLAQFWMHSLSRWRKGQEPAPAGLSDEYRSALSAIVADQTLRGRVGRCILCSQLAFLLAADEKWTRQNLLPLFDPDNDRDDFEAAWDGFLAGSNLNPSVTKLLEGASLKAIQHIDTGRDRRQRFTDFYTSMLMYFVPDPLDVWIPELFKNGTAEMRHHFAWAIQRLLRGMNDDRRRGLWRGWLKQYWEGRLQGVPRPLDDEEIESMLDWLPHLKPVFPAAVDLALQMQVIRLQRASLLYGLAKGGFEDSYPVPLGRLLVRLGEYDAQAVMWHDVRGLIERICERDIPPELNQNLRELIAKLGL